MGLLRGTVRGAQAVVAEDPRLDKLIQVAEPLAIPKRLEPRNRNANAPSCGTEAGTRQPDCCRWCSVDS